MSDASISAALQRASEVGQRGMLGLGESISAAFTSMRLRVGIAADNGAPDDLRALVTWGAAHSPVACTVHDSPVISVEVEIT